MFVHPQAFGLTDASSGSIQVSYSCGVDCPIPSVNDIPLIVGLVVGLGGGLILIIVVAAVLVRRGILDKQASYMIPTVSVLQ